MSTTPPPTPTPTAVAAIVVPKFEQQVNRIILVAVGQNWKKMILSLKFSATAVVVEDTTHYIEDLLLQLLMLMFIRFQIICSDVNTTPNN